MSARNRTWATLLLGGAGIVLAATLATPAAATPGASGGPERWLLLPWERTVGRILGREADSEGPKSFAVKPDGGGLGVESETGLWVAKAGIVHPQAREASSVRSLTEGKPGFTIGQPTRRPRP